MIPQRILKADRVQAMRQGVKEEQPAALEVYRQSEPCAFGDDDLLNTTISVPDVPPALVAPHGHARELAAHDADNAVLIHEYLGALSRTQAADDRLWVTLAHTTFWDYVRARWGADEGAKLRSSVLSHWFVPEGGGKGALRRQAISRLWWAAHLTCAPWERDPELARFRTADRFHFTRILLKRQQIYFDLIERNYGSDLRLRTCVLASLERHAPAVAWRDELSREVAKRLNLMLKHRRICSFDVDALHRTCDDLVSAVASSIAAGAAPVAFPVGP